MKKEILIYGIYEEMVQSASEANIGRELTETKLKRIACVFIDNQDFSGAVYSAIVSAVKEAVKEDEWQEYDEMHRDIPLEQVV